MKLTMLLLIATISMASSACSNLLDSELKVLDSSKKMNMCEYEGSVILVVNVASKCGYTYQYETLQGLYMTSIKMMALLLLEYLQEILDKNILKKHQ